MKKFTSLAATLAASAVGLTLFSGISEAQATSFVPQVEGEVKLTNLACFTGLACQAPVGFSISSEAFGSGYGQSYLFVDKPGTANNYGAIKFGASDAGTNASTEFWFRPVGKLETGSFPEGGQFEGGLFTFTFDNIIPELSLKFLDTEQSGTSVLKVNGAAYPGGDVTPGPNNNIKNLILTDVKSFQVKLGSVGGNFNPGDGVLLQIHQTKSVPEPASILGLGALGAAGAFGLRKGKKASQAV